MTMIISAFPGCGKTYFYENFKDKFKGGILDSDSSEFSWIKDKDGNNTNVRNPDFPNNYIQHIKDNSGKVDIIFVSSHEVVRNTLRENNIKYILVYPDKSLKEEWIERFKNRGDNDKFINFISSNWDNFIDEMINEEYSINFKLGGKYKSVKDIVFSPGTVWNNKGE